MLVSADFLILGFPLVGDLVEDFLFVMVIMRN